MYIVSKAYDGSGDLIQAVKIADFIQKTFPISVIIVVPDPERNEKFFITLDHEDAIRPFLFATNRFIGLTTEMIMGLSGMQKNYKHP